MIFLAFISNPVVVVVLSLVDLHVLPCVLCFPRGKGRFLILWQRVISTPFWYTECMELLLSVRGFPQSQIVHCTFLNLCQFLHLVCFRAGGCSQCFRISLPLVHETHTSEELKVTFSVFQIAWDSVQLLVAKSFIIYMISTVFHRENIEKLLQSDTWHQTWMDLWQRT